MQGVIIRGVGGNYYVDTNDSVIECRARGLFRNQNIKPLVGDKVIIRLTEENKNFGGKLIGYHQTKQEFFAKKGIDILFVWDYEWFEDFPKRQIINEQTKQKIMNFL